MPDNEEGDLYVPYVYVDSVEYDDVSPWPTLADGSGPSLERDYNDQYPNDVINWKPSELAGGTPGFQYNYAYWQLINFDANSDGALNPAETAAADATADPDDDGVTNLLEYALFMDPNVSGAFSSAITLSKVGTDLSYVYKKRRVADDLTYTVIYGDDLQGWADWAGVAAVSSIDNGDGTLSVTNVGALLLPSNRLFLRLKVELN